MDTKGNISAIINITGEDILTTWTAITGKRSTRTSQKCKSDTEQCAKRPKIDVHSGPSKRVQEPRRHKKLNLSELTRLNVLIWDYESIRLYFIKTNSGLTKNKLDTANRTSHRVARKSRIRLQRSEFPSVDSVPYFTEDYIELTFYRIRKTSAELRSCTETCRKVFSSKMSEYRRCGQNHSDFHAFMNHCGCYRTSDKWQCFESFDYGIFYRSLNREWEYGDSVTVSQGVG